MAFHDGERSVEVTRGQRSLVDSEFDSMRDRFEAEMKRVEEEMSRLRNEFEGSTPRTTQHHASHHSTSSRQTTQSSGAVGQFSPSSQQQQQQQLTHHPAYNPYFDAMGKQSPLIKDDTDGKTLRLRFNVKDYLPEEVTVKTVDNRLMVHAKHEEKNPSRTCFREYNQEFMLPPGTNPEAITSTLSTDGVLTVEAPLPPRQIDQAYPTAMLKH